MRIEGCTRGCSGGRQVFFSPFCLSAGGQRALTFAPAFGFIGLIAVSSTGRPTRTRIRSESYVRGLPPRRTPGPGHRAQSSYPSEGGPSVSGGLTGPVALGESRPKQRKRQGHNTISSLATIGRDWCLIGPPLRYCASVSGSVSVVGKFNRLAFCP